MKRLAILLLLLATTTQAFVAQTHVHASLATQASHQLAAGADVADAGTPLPTGGDDSGCLLCQIAAHGAAGFAPHETAIPQIAGQFTVAAHRYAPDPQSLPLTHAWSSRGPPQS